MSEYSNVEKPFLDKLSELGWEVINQGQGLPQDPTISYRSDFNEIVLRGVFKETIRKINLTDNGEPWLTDKQLDEVYNQVADLGNIKLHEANKAIFELLLTRTTVDRNELTGEESPKVDLIDFADFANNSFIAINQFKVLTAGGPRESIIPDIVLFVNGMPFVVIECKDEDENDLCKPLREAEKQIRRYSNLRDDKFGINEGEEKLFHHNMFSIITHGKEARLGTISGGFDYYYNWKDIFPEQYKTIPVTKENESEQEVLIRGILNKEILIDVLRNFTLFMEIKEGVEIKLVCRYQQYRAVGKILDRMLKGETGTTRSGVVWHTQGSGKSLTMVFLIRKLRCSQILKGYKVIMINDRKDLEKQLSNTASMTGETVNVIANRASLRDELKDDRSNLNMVMIHKFLDENGVEYSEALRKAYSDGFEIPKFKPFEVINSSEKVLILIDEAHRTQGGDMGDNLFTAFPNATRIAFTGTPLLTERHKIKTHERFGGSDFIDKYKIRQSVRDRATLDIVYIGKTSNDEIIGYEDFHREFEDEFKDKSDEMKLDIQKRYGSMQKYLENDDRISKIAEDIVDHYVKEILPNGFKGQVVTTSIYAACCYQYKIQEAINAKIEVAESAEVRDEEHIKLLKFLKVCSVVTMQDNNEEGFISEARKKTKELNAVESFKKDFDYDKPNTGVALLCVCDRLLTGFDAPIEQVMYLDKNLREHDLLQAIARVNRTKGDKKTHGIVVDYYGVANNLKEALAIFGDEDEQNAKEFLEYFRDINKEIPTLESRYTRLIQLFSDKGIDIEAFVNQTIIDKDIEIEIAEACIDLAGKIEFRARFDAYAKSFFNSLELLFNVSQVKKYWIPAKRFAYLIIRIRNRYRDDTIDLKWAGEKVRKLIDEHLKSLNIDMKIEPTSLMSDNFPKEVNQNKSSKSKASDMEHAIRRHIKVNMENDPAMYTKFNDRFEALLKKYKGHWENMIEKFSELRDEMKVGRKDGEDGLSSIQQPFYDFVKMKAFTGSAIEDEVNEKIKELIIQITAELKDYLQIHNFWTKEAKVKELRGKLGRLLRASRIEEIKSCNKELTTDILTLAKKRENELIQINNIEYISEEPTSANAAEDSAEYGK